MQRLAVALTGALLSLFTALTDLGTAEAAPPSCRQYDSIGFCVVGAQQDGGDGVVPTNSGAGSTSTNASCTLRTSGAVIPCQEGAAWWVQSMQCYAQVMSEQPPKDSAVWGGHTDGAIYTCTFYTDGRGFRGVNGFSFW